MYCVFDCFINFIYLVKLVYIFLFSVFVWCGCDSVSMLMLLVLMLIVYVGCCMCCVCVKVWCVVYCSCDVDLCYKIMCGVMWCVVFDVCMVCWLCGGLFFDVLCEFCVKMSVCGVVKVLRLWKVMWCGFFEIFDGDVVVVVKDVMDFVKKFWSVECGFEYVLFVLMWNCDWMSKVLYKYGVTEEATRRAFGERAGVSELELMNLFNKLSVEGLLVFSDELKKVFECVSVSGSEVGSKEFVFVMIDESASGARATMVALEGCDLKVFRKEIIGVNEWEFVGVGKKMWNMKK